MVFFNVVFSSTRVKTTKIFLTIKKKNSILNKGVIIIYVQLPYEKQIDGTKVLHYEIIKKNDQLVIIILPLACILFFPRFNQSNN